MNSYLIKFSHEFLDRYEWDLIRASSLKKLIKKFVWAYMFDPEDWYNFSDEIARVPDEDLTELLKIAHRYVDLDIEAVTTVEMPSVLFMKDTKEDRGLFRQASFERIEDESL